MSECSPISFSEIETTGVNRVYDQGVLHYIESLIPTLPVRDQRTFYSFINGSTNFTMKMRNLISDLRSRARQEGVMMQPDNLTHVLRETLFEMGDNDLAHQLFIEGCSKDELADKLRTKPQAMRISINLLRIQLLDRLQVHYPQFMGQVSAIPNLEPESVPPLLRKFEYVLSERTELMLGTFFGDARGTEGTFRLDDTFRQLRLRKHMTLNQRDILPNYMAFALTELEEKAALEEQRGL